MGYRNKNVPRTFKGMVLHLRQFFTDQSIPQEEKHRLWDVLSALRGPDYERLRSGAYSDKTATTCVIRSALLDESYNLDGIPALVQPDYSSNVAERKRLDRRLRRTGDMDHFARHAKDAFLALGLRWDEVNPGRSPIQPRGAR